MHHRTNEVLGAATELGCEATKLEAEATKLIRLSVCRQYADEATAWPIWEHFIERVSIQDATAWGWVGEFLGESETIMFFDKEEDESAVLFERGSCVVPTLENCTGFEFYLTDKNVTYVICFNHHDFLICAGRSKGWLEQRKN